MRMLRKAFLVEMSAKLVKSTELGDVINAIHPSKVKFLEANLEQLTSAHKALVRENYELKSQAPRAEGNNYSFYLIFRALKLEILYAHMI